MRYLSSVFTAAVIVLFTWGFAAHMNKAAREDVRPVAGAGTLAPGAAMTARTANAPPGRPAKTTKPLFAGMGFPTPASVTFPTVHHTARKGPARATVPEGAPPAEEVLPPNAPAPRLEDSGSDEAIPGVSAQ